MGVHPHGERAAVEWPGDGTLAHGPAR
jgi:hypothetical protein